MMWFRTTYWLRGLRGAERSYSTFKVRRGDLVQGKEQWLHFPGTAVKRYPITRWSTLKSDWSYSLQPKMEKLYTVSKNKTGSWLSPNASGGLTPLSPPSELPEIPVATREQSGLLCFHSRWMPVSPGASWMQPRDPCRPWRGTLASGHKPRWI